MPPVDLSQKFQEVLATYLEAKEKGQPVDPAALVRAHPDLAAELNEYFANEKRFNSAAGGLAAGEPRHTVLRASSRIGDYEILNEIARGGMGVVYRARHVSLQRLVALKMLLGGSFAGRDGLRRFRTEAEVVAGLDHPHIVPIYDIGTHEGQAFFCMKLIEGPSLKQQVAGYVGKPKQAARLIIQIARAVHHAHQRGILHRDLKPGNILMQMGTNEKAKGRKKGKDYPISGIPASATFNPQFAVPYVTDFGLAKRVEADGEASHSTAVVGTASYMAPEQATGRSALSVAADVYGLGAILFELLTGQPPFVGQNQLEILYHVAHTEAPSPLELQPDLDPDLAQICLKCLRKSPDERYASAEALALELELWLEGEPLSVRAPTSMEKLWRSARRHPLATAMLAAILFVIAGSIGMNFYLDDLNRQLRDAQEKSDTQEGQLAEQATKALALADRERRARVEAEKAKADLLVSVTKEKAALDAKVNALKESQRLLVQHYLTNGQQMLQRGDPYGAAVWFAEAFEKDQSDPERAAMHRIRLGMTLRQAPALTQTWFFDAKIRIVRLSPSGDRLLTVDAESVPSLWDAKTGRRVGEIPRPGGAIHAAEFSPDGQWFVLAGADGSARLFVASSATTHGNSLKHTQSIHTAVFSSDSKWLATGSADKSARVWDVAGAKPVGRQLVHNHEVRSTAFHPDGKKLLTASANAESKEGEIHVWDLAMSKQLFTKPVPQGIRAAGFGRDGKRIYAVTSAHKINLWDAATGDLVKMLAGLKVKGDLGQWFAPNLDRFIQATDADVKVVDLPKGTTGSTLAQTSSASLAQFSPGGRYVVTASANVGVQLWRPDNGQPIGPALPHARTVVAAHFSANDQWLATITDDHVVRLWHLIRPDKDKMVSIPKSKGTLLSVSPDGKKALLAQTKSIIVWDIDQARSGASISLGGVALHTGWSANGNRVALACRDEVRVWNLTSNKVVSLALNYGKNEKPETSLRAQFSPNMKELAVWGKNHFWVATLGDNPVLQKKFNNQTHVLDWDGQRVALWKSKGTLEIQEWTSEKVKSLQKLAVLPEHFRFNPDGQTGVAAFADGSLRIWDLNDAKPITLPFFHGEPIKQIVYSANGRLLATVGVSGQIRLWDTSTGQLLSPALTPGGTLADMAFRTDAEALFAWTADGTLQRWSLRPLEGSPADIARSARRSAGQEIDAVTGSLVSLDAPALRQLWGEP